MKLPDFSTFAPLNENREQMNAQLPTDLSFVSIEDRLSNADLEKQRQPVAKPAPKLVSDTAPTQPASAPPPGVSAAPAAPQQAQPQYFIPVPASMLQKAKPTETSRILLIVQLSLLCNFLLVSGIFYLFGAPWEKNPPVQYIIHQTEAPKAEKKGKSQKKPSLVVKPHLRTPTEPFYRRHEYVDQYGIKRTIIQQIPAPGAPKPAPKPAH